MHVIQKYLHPITYSVDSQTVDKLWTKARTSQLLNERECVFRLKLD